MRLRYPVIPFTILICAFLLPGVVAQIAAQKLPKPVAIDSNFVSAGNAAVEIWLNKHTGQFWVARKGGALLLFSGEDGGTSATSVRFDNTTFTNNRLRAPEAPVGTVYMPLGSAFVEADTVFFDTDILLKDKALHLRQRFVPMIEGDYGFIRVYTTVTNTSSTGISAGVQTLFDLFLKDMDGMTVTVDGNTVGTETQWTGSSVPDRYEAESATAPWKIIARLRGSDTTPPDVLTVGNWNFKGYLGAPAWDYTPSGLRMAADNATLLQWNTSVLQPGDSRTVVTDYGVQIDVATSLSCTVDSLVLNFSETGFDPDPFKVVTHIVNTGQLEISNMQMQIVLPPEVHLAPGESATRTIVGPLGVGQSIPVSWFLKADTSHIPKTVTILTILDNGSSVDTCEVELFIPPLPIYGLETICPEDIYLELTDDELGYKNEVFTVEARVRNVGNTALNGITAFLPSPEILPLVSGSEYQFFEPDVIQPNEENAGTWTFQAPPQCKDTVVELTIVLQRLPFYADSCTFRVHFPATQPVYCVPNGILTSGTSYHSSLITNNPYNTSDFPQAVLYIISDSISHVSVTEEISGTRHEFTVNACDMKTLVLEDLSNSLLRPFFEAVETRSVTIQATHPITVFAGSLLERHGDATLLLPDHALGREYLSIGYNYGMSGETEQFTITATEDNTTIDFNLSSTSDGGILGRTPQQMTLNATESFTIHQGATGGRFGGISGSQFSASHPIAMTGGMATGHIPGWSLSLEFANPAVHQVLPVEALGTEYVVMPYRSRFGGYTVRIIAAEPGTNLTVGTTQEFMAAKGDRFETQLVEPTLITADKPILVAQYAHSASFDFSGNGYGDGSMVVLPPIDRFASCHTFPTSIGSNIGNAGVRFPTAYANLVVYPGGEDQVSINGVLLSDTAFHALPGSPYSVATVEFLPGVQNIGTTDLRGVGVTVYAFEFHDAYSFIPGYVAGPKVTGIQDIPAAEGLTLHTWPNPATDRVVAELSLPGNLRGSLAVYDAMGRALQTVHEGEFKQGTNHFAFGTETYSSGTYFLVLQHGTVRQSVRFTVLR